ncbi:MAG: dipeptide epimerase [Planctomycetota bacterium]
MDFALRAFDLELKDPFTISRGTVTSQPTLIVEVRQDGMVGYGEATTNSYYGATLESMRDALLSVRDQLATIPLENPAEVWKTLDPQLGGNRFAQCALDCAIWDWYGKSQGLPLWKLWGFRSDDPQPPTCFTLGMDTLEVMSRKMDSMPDWPVYKVKVGPDGGFDLVQHLKQTAESAGRDVRFRVDANCAWRADQVLGYAEQLARLGVELIEQPLPAEEYGAMQALKGKSPIPLMADESCQIESDVDRCLDAFDAINIKLVKCGGLTPARRMIARAKQRGLKVMVGCMTESSVGIAAGAHLLPLLDFADLDGALLLKEDIAAGIQWRAGEWQPTDQTGLGVQLTEAAVSAAQDL